MLKIGIFILILVIIVRILYIKSKKLKEDILINSFNKSFDKRTKELLEEEGDEEEEEEGDEEEGDEEEEEEEEPDDSTNQSAPTKYDAIAKAEEGVYKKLDELDAKYQSDNTLLKSLTSVETLSSIALNVIFSRIINKIIAKIRDKVFRQSVKTGLKMGINVLSKIGIKLGEKAMSKLGTVIGKKAAEKIAIKAGSKVAVKLAAAGTKLAVKASASATLGPVGIAMIAVDVVMTGLTLGLDIADVGGYGNMQTLREYYDFRREIWKEFRKQIETTNDEYGKPFSFPIIIGPFDASETYYDDLDKVITDMGNDVEEPLFKNLHNFVAKIKSKYPDMTEDELLKWTENNQSKLIDENSIIIKADSKLCVKYGGTVKGAFCSYSSSDDCKNSMNWPPTEDDTYVEWDSDRKVCEVASTGLYDLCQNVGFEYDWNKRMCNITKEYCLTKGGEWKYDNYIKGFDCVIPFDQKAVEMIFGETMVRGLKQVFDSDQYCPCSEGTTSTGITCQGCPKEHPYLKGALCYDNDFVSKRADLKPCSDWNPLYKDWGGSCWGQSIGRGSGVVGSVVNEYGCSPGYNHRGIGGVGWCTSGLKTAGEYTYPKDYVPYTESPFASQTIIDSPYKGWEKRGLLYYPKCPDGFHEGGTVNFCESDGGIGIKVPLTSRYVCPPNTKNVAGVCWSTPYPSTYMKKRKVVYGTKDGTATTTNNC